MVYGILIKIRTESIIAGDMTMFDPKRAARVGAKRLRQRQDYRLAKREMENPDEFYDSDRENDLDSEEKELVLNEIFKSNRKRRLSK